jgi:hypothetical protein
LGFWILDFGFWILDTVPTAGYAMPLARCERQQYKFEIDLSVQKEEAWKLFLILILIQNPKSPRSYV